MLKKASGASGDGPLSKAWGWVSSRRVRLSWYVVAPIVAAVIAGLIALVVEYGFFNGRDGHHDQWAVAPTANMRVGDASGEVWAEADGTVHVTGVLEDVRKDYASAQLLLVPSGPSAQIPAPIKVGDGAGERAPIGSGDQGIVFDSDTSRIEAKVCKHDRSAGTPPQCGPPTEIYNVNIYQP